MGRQGSGKTIFLTKKAIELYKKGIKIYANFHLNNIPYEKINYNDIVECKYSNCAVLIDEIHLLLPSREWYRPHCKKICDSFLSQVRKQEVELYGTTQLLRKVDVRLREEADFYYECTRYILKDGEHMPVGFADFKIPKTVPTFISVEIYDLYSGQVANFDFHANPYYEHYDTRQIIKIEGLDDEINKPKKKKKSEEIKTNDD